MFSENLKTLRKQKGMSQETLAQQLHVVRQTVSKWEKGLSVPDAEMLVRIAEFFEVSVSDLLGEKMDEASDVNEIAAQLALLNEQLANRSRRNQKILKVVLKVVLICLAVVIALGIMLCVIGMVRSYEINSRASKTTTVDLICTLDGEEYYYSITYDGEYYVVESGGDEWIYDHVNLSEYDFDANVMISQIEAYFEDRGGEVEISDGM
ncbi:MAG: helix-turn-helix domain-containing protein [Clostridiales bacterium]|nr:helix-turn-helix domain-containing protein [Clostridiales bacterium]